MKLNKSHFWLEQIKADLYQSQYRLPEIEADLDSGHLPIDMFSRSNLSYAKSQLSQSRITIFATAKPFVGHSRVIQRNALKSWTLLEPRPEIILFGDEEGAAKIASELSLRHIPNVKRNEYGTIFLNDMFEQAQKISSTDTLVYVNADIILTSDFMPVIDKVKAQFENFLIIGRRNDVDIPVMLDFKRLNNSLLEIINNI